MSVIKFNKKMWLVLGLIIALFSGCAPALSGKLVPSVSPVGTKVFGDARINVISISGKQAESFVVKVRRDGSFVLDQNLKKGRYLVEALVPGYKIESKEIDLNKTNKVVLNLVKNSGSSKLGTGSVDVNMGVDASRGDGGATLTPPRL